MPTAETVPILLKKVMDSGGAQTKLVKIPLYHLKLLVILDYQAVPRFRCGECRTPIPASSEQFFVFDSAKTLHTFSPVMRPFDAATFAYPLRELA